MFQNLNDVKDLDKYSLQKKKILDTIIKNEKIKGDISLIFNHKFSISQMDQIKIGLKKGVDVSIYANPKYDWKVMRQYRLMQEINIPKEYLDFFIKNKFNDKQLNELRLGYRNKITFLDYSNPNYNFFEMREIRQNLEKIKDKIKKKRVN